MAKENYTLIAEIRHVILYIIMSFVVQMSYPCHESCVALTINSAV